MLEESASAIPSSVWASMNSWFTPTVLFLLLNLMIGTIAFTSTFSGQKHRHNQQKPSQHDLQQPTIARSPSVLQRIKSINFYGSHYRSQEPLDSSLHHKQTLDSDAVFGVQTAHQSPNLETPEHYLFRDANSHENGETVGESQTHFNFEDFHEEKVEESSEQSMEEVYSQLTGGHFSRTKSDTQPASGEIPTKLPAKMRKSASSKSAFAHFEEKDMVEVRRPATVREKGNAKASDVDEGVDAKADDFINKFKQQLKLQRLDSIIRYKDMIGGGR